LGRRVGSASGRVAVGMALSPSENLVFVQKSFKAPSGGGGKPSQNGGKKIRVISFLGASVPE